MRVAPPSLLSLVAFLVLAVVSVAACKLDSAGLGPDAGRTNVVVPDASATGAAASGGAGTSGLAGASGTAGVSGGAGSTGPGGHAGTSAVGGSGGVATAGVGAAGEGVAGAGGESGAGEAGVAGQGQAGDGPADAGDDGGVTEGPLDAGPPAWVVGCADGTREGLQSFARFPDVAACSGAWSVPGLVAPETLTPQCQRAAGNDGLQPDGEGCSVADLCAEGWHVCESAQEFAAKATNCDNAFPGGAVKMFFASRQRGPMTTCDPANETGTNNVYGCGNFGSNANTACTPFMRMLRDYDCKNNPPWMCVDGPINDSTTELLDITKTSSDHGGVLCCR